MQVAPPFMWPPQPRVLLKWLLGFPGYFWPVQAIFLGLALVSWLCLTPDMGGMKSFSVSWLMLLLIRNLALLTAFAGGLHAWLYTKKAQGVEYKYNSKWLTITDSCFLFRSQLWDNVFWSLCSAVPVWTAYEAFMYWLQANSFAPTVSWQTHPAYCAFLVLVTPFWLDVHFFATHRLLHWRPLYRLAHYLHHKNINPGPWSGLAMHPVEHLIFFSAALLYWIVPSHPSHVLYLLLLMALAAPLSHTGYDRLLVRKKTILNGNYFHYLHHKHFTVNYGGQVPFDKWLGTFHDGTEEATEAMKKRRVVRLARSSQRAN
jgi:sterol desaturase/sphingolipid hydroxylase (fatty acid hydroxylase superfamily)